MNAIIGLNSKIALGAMLAATPFLAACGSAGHQSLVPQSFAPRSQTNTASPQTTTACTTNCATLLEPLHAAIVGGVLELTHERADCAGESVGSAPEITVPDGTSVIINAQSLPLACPSATRSPSDYFIVAVAASEKPGQRGAIWPALPIDGPNLLPAAVNTLSFGESSIGLPSGSVAFFIAYCASCVHTK
jgi:hypothetical protein